MSETSKGVSPPSQNDGSRVSFARIAEIAANLATVVAAVLVSIVLLKVFIFPRPVTRGTREDVEQTQKVNLKSVLPGVDWNKNGRTLVMAISTQCHFCTESLPLFQRITNDSGPHIKTLALLPQIKADAEEYLRKGGVRVDDIRQVTLSSIGVEGTPTLLLVDAAGKVTNVWYGKLSSDQENDLLAELKKST
jgi:hypothetical protein